MSQLERLERREAAIKEEKKLAKLEDAFGAKKQAGFARIAEEKADAFKAAKSSDEYESLVRQIAPPVTDEEKRSLREARQDFRVNHRKPTKDGAQPAAIGATAALEEI